MLGASGSWIGRRPAGRDQDWLIGKTVSSVDAYQWWTRRDLAADGTGDDGYWCFGEGASDSVKDGNRSASVVEGYDDNCCDVYDPDEVHERGIVSGHEFGHVYGEETDHSTCTSLSGCHIMQGGR